MQHHAQATHAPFWVPPGFDPWLGCPETFLASRMVREPGHAQPTRPAPPTFTTPPGVQRPAPGISSARSTGMRPQL